MIQKNKIKLSFKTYLILIKKVMNNFNKYKKMI